MLWLISTSTGWHKDLQPAQMEITLIPRHWILLTIIVIKWIRYTSKLRLGQLLDSLHSTGNEDKINPLVHHLIVHPCILESKAAVPRVWAEFMLFNVAIWSSLKKCIGGSIFLVASTEVMNFTWLFSVVDAQTWIVFVPFVSSVLLE